MSLESDDTPSGPFEGPEKLLEIWFAPSASDVPAASTTEHGRIGLRSVSRSVWEEMLAIVKCQVLSVVEGTDMDAYLLRYVRVSIPPHVRRNTTSFFDVQHGTNTLRPFSTLYMPPWTCFHS